MRNMDLNDAILNAAVDQIIQPILQRLAAQTSQHVTAKILASIAGASLASQVGIREAGPEGCVGGEIRALIKDAWPTGSFTYVIQAILTGLAPGTGFSGFEARGRLTVDGNNITFKPRGLSYRYNVTQWSEKLRF